jgi:hypothetical protein
MGCVGLLMSTPLIFPARWIAARSVPNRSQKIRPVGPSIFLSEVDLLRIRRDTPDDEVGTHFQERVGGRRNSKQATVRRYILGIQCFSTTLP